MRWGLPDFIARHAPVVGTSIAAAMLCGFADAPAEVLLAEPFAAIGYDDLAEEDAVFASDAAALSRLLASGRASFYADKFHGRRTANGEIFRQTALTAAHRDLPMGSVVKVTCAKSGKSVTVRVNDRGPFRGGRVIDLSKAAARQLGMLNAGLADVTLELLPTT